MYSMIFILINFCAFLIGVEHVACAISAADQAACAAGRAPAVRAILSREYIARSGAQCTTCSQVTHSNDASKGNDAVVDGQPLVTVGDIDSPAVRSSESENTRNEARRNARGTRMGSDGDASSSGSSEYRTPEGGEGSAAEDSSSVEGIKQGSSAGNNSSGGDEERGVDHDELGTAHDQDAESYPATVPVFDLRTTYNLRSGPAGNVWAWYRPNSRANAPSYCPNQQDRRNPVYKFCIERAPNTKCQFFIRTAAQARSDAYFLGFEGNPAHSGRATVNATWTLGVQSATPVYIIPWNSRYRIATNRQHEDQRYAMLGVSGQPKGNLGWDAKDTATSWIIEASE